MSNSTVGRSNEGSDWTFRLPRLAWPGFLRRLSPVKTISVGLLGLVAVGAFCFGLSQTRLFAVQRIDVNGLDYLNRSDVMTLAKVHSGEPMVAVSRHRVAKAISANPWVAHVSVYVSWPHVVTIDVTERRPIGQTQVANNQWVIVGTDGVVLQTMTKPVSGLPDLLGVSAPDRTGGRLASSAGDVVTVGEAMPPSLEPHVVQIQEQNNVLRLGLNTGAIVVLGDKSDLVDKLTAAATVVSNTDTTKISTLDVSSPHVPVATPVTAPKAPTANSTSTNSSGKSSTKSKATHSSTTTTSTTVAHKPLD
jgi:cell division protein FtsQ